MFNNFIFENFPEKLVGYEWERRNPEKILCIVHGIGEHAGRYDRMAGYLTEAGIGVIGMDLPGHGKSDGVKGHTAPRSFVFKAVNAMLDFAAEKYPGIPIILYGHSMGGNIVMDYRQRGEENDLPEKYIVSAPWLRLVRKVPKPVFLGLRELSKIKPEITLASGCKPELLGNLEFTGDYDKDELVHTCITLKTASECYEIGEALALGKLENNGRAVGKPFLLMHGSSDKICDVKGSRMVAALMEGSKSFRYIEWPGYYHEIHNGGPFATGEEVIRTIIDFALE